MTKFRVMLDGKDGWFLQALVDVDGTPTWTDKKMAREFSATEATQVANRLRQTGNSVSLVPV